jgi:hypothetical protein
MGRPRKQNREETSSIAVSVRLRRALDGLKLPKETTSTTIFRIMKERNYYFRRFRQLIDRSVMNHTTNVPNLKQILATHTEASGLDLARHAELLKKLANCEEDTFEHLSVGLGIPLGDIYEVMDYFQDLLYLSDEDSLLEAEMYYNRT